MSESIGNPARLNPPGPAAQTRQARRADLRRTVGEMVGATFFGQMLKIARIGVGKAKYGYGGRGEEIFGAQLDQEFARLAGQRMHNGLTEALVRQLEGRG